MWIIYNIFYIWLFKQNTTKKWQINKLFLEPEFDISNNKKYKVKAIRDSIVYAKKIER